VESDGTVVSIADAQAEEPTPDAESAPAAQPPRRNAEQVRPTPPPREPEETAAEEPIVSPATAAASVAAFSRITELSVAADRERDRERDIGLGAGNLTIERLVREELRPILRDWLDANLPDIVENIVKSEVARLVQGVTKR
ncbi:MAG: DUF2497 domain-containing protein, partial [Alphaproteobacteria bacterium]|nr:DUF2497 domain-containing protein [Alphaproteobacteria bacterium]